MRKELLLVIVISMMSSVFAQEIPVPHGVQGIVYKEDGATEVEAGTHVSVRDLDSGYYAEGVTGIGNNPGMYSFTIDGEDDDVIVIKAWNDFHITNRTVTLKGSMHNINLVLSTESKGAIAKLIGRKEESSSDGFQEDKIVARTIVRAVSVSGIIHARDVSDISSDAKVKIINIRTGEDVYAELDESPEFGRFSAVLKAKSDDEVAIVLEDREYSAHAVIEGRDLEDLNLELDGNVLLVEEKPEPVEPREDVPEERRLGKTLFYSLIITCIIFILLTIYILVRRRYK